MQQQVFADKLDALGVLVGVFVALAGLGTLVGMPWQYTSGAVTMVLQILGALATVALGVGLAWLTHQ
ncbi:hypothetical protein [Halobacterium zhouii]|uniref:hypothetical protein n=1 Tax=Halobacterium zhouii TaxID=2902624 RepID=UPI001E3BA718|nr:hypothetical protein [Halobacterium zhouii]